MAGTREGGQKAALRNKLRDPDYYKKIGAQSWKNPNRSRVTGFAANPELAKIAGAIGGSRRLSDYTRKITLTSGETCLVDADDYGRVTQMGQWHLSDGGYAIRRPVVDGRKTIVRMHRIILDTPEGFETDHINHNKLDNRKSNLRVCTRGENQNNKQSVGTWLDKRRGTWRVEITVEAKKYSFGSWADKEIAMHVASDIRQQLIGKTKNEYAQKKNTDEANRVQAVCACGNPDHVKEDQYYEDAKTLIGIIKEIDTGSL